MSQKSPNRAGSKRLVLTAFGGAVFESPQKMIVQAAAAGADIIRQSGLQVYFVRFDERSFMESMAADLE
jgi:hypothetical protein